MYGRRDLPILDPFRRARSPALPQYSIASSVRPACVEVVGDKLRLGVGDDGEFFAQGFGDAPMQDLPPAPQQAFVSRVLDERVFEAVARFGRGSVAKHQLGFLQLRQRASQRGLVALMARLDRLVAVKEIAQIGAAIAREFSYSLLHAVRMSP